MSYVKGWTGGGTTSVTAGTPTVFTIDGATAGSLLVATLVYRDVNGATTVTYPGWAEATVQGTVGGGLEATLWNVLVRTATGDASDNLTATADQTGLPSFVAQEFADVAAGLPDDLDQNTANLITNVTSQACGTATPAEADGLAVAIRVSSRNTGWNVGDPTTTTAPTGYIDLLEYEAFASGNPSTSMSSKFYTGTGDESPVYTTSDTGARSWGLVMVFASTGEPPSETTLTIEDDCEAWTARDSGNRSGALAFAGTWTGTVPTGMEWRAENTAAGTEITAWNTTFASFSTGAGTWSGSVEIPDNVTAAGDSIKVQFRPSAGAAGVVSSTTPARIVRAYGLIGQSNVAKWATDGTALTPSADAWRFTNAGGFAQLTSTGNGDVSFANTMIAADGVPTLILNYAIGGSGLYPGTDTTRWLNESPVSPWGQFSLNGFDKSLDTMEGIVWVQGEKDAQSPYTSYANYLQGLSDLVSRSRAQITNGSIESQLPWVVALIGNNGAVDETSPNYIPWGDVRRAQIDYVASDTNAYDVCFYDFPMQDTVHVSAEGYTSFGERVANIFKYLNGDAAYWSGPRISSAALTSSTQVDVTIEQFGGTDFTPVGPTQATDFRVSTDDFVTVAPAVSNAVRTSATSIRLTLAAPVSNVKLSYNQRLGYSVAGKVIDNSALALPLVHVETMDVSGSVKSVTITLTDNSGSPVANLSNLKWAWFDQTTPGAFIAPTNKGSTGVTDGSGNLTLSIPNSTLNSGQTGWLDVTDSTGSVGFVHKGFSGPVVVS